MRLFCGDSIITDWYPYAYSFFILPPRKIYNLKLLHYEDGSTKYNFMKLIDSRTILYEKYMSEKIGIWIDIFPIDGLPNSVLWTKILCCRMEFWRRLLNISMSRTDYGKSKIRILIKKIIRPIVCLFSSKFINQKINSVFKKYDYDQAKYVGAVGTGYSYKARNLKEMYKNYKMQFEGNTYNVPCGWDAILNGIYGDYMEMPAVEDRIQHEFKAYWK